MSDSYRLQLEADLLRTDLHSCQVELERVRAEAAVMRGALEKVDSTFKGETLEQGGCLDQITFALSASSGASLLASYRESVELLSHALFNRADFLERRDTLLATVKGETS